MKTAFWSYVIGQVALVGVSLWGKMSIWISLIPTFILIGVSAGMVALMLGIEFAFNLMETEDDPFDWNDEDEKDCGEA